MLLFLAWDFCSGWLGLAKGVLGLPSGFHVAGISDMLIVIVIIASQFIRPHTCTKGNTIDSGQAQGTGGGRDSVSSLSFQLSDGSEGPGPSLMDRVGVPPKSAQLFVALGVG